MANLARDMTGDGVGNIRMYVLFYNAAHIYHMYRGFRSYKFQLHCTHAKSIQLARVSGIE